VPGPHQQEPGQLPLGAGGGLERGGGGAGHLAQDPLQVGQQRQPTLDLVVGLGRVAVRQAGIAATASHSFGLYFMVHEPSG